MSKDKKNVTRTKSQNPSKDDKQAELAVDSAVVNAALIKGYNPTNGDVSVAALNNELEKQVKRINDGDMFGIEKVLVCQIHSLNSVYTGLMVKAAAQKSLKGLKGYADIGLRAQRQCNNAINNLIALKKPRVYVQNLVSTSHTINKTNMHGLVNPQECDGFIPNQLDKNTVLVEDNSQNAIGYNVGQQHFQYGAASSMAEIHGAKNV